MNKKQVMTSSLPEKHSSLAAHALERGVRLYQLTLASLVPGSCRFEPSCSSYARQAFIDHGAVKGATLTVGRIARCHPWCDGGYDPVPGKPCHHDTPTSAV